MRSRARRSASVFDPSPLVIVRILPSIPIRRSPKQTTLNYLLDTCVISELIAKCPDEKAVSWVDSQAEVRLYLSAITIGEIVKGIEKLANAQRKETLTAWLEDELLERFKGRLVDLDVDVLLVWKKRGRQILTFPAFLLY
ncbi:MAG TPA: PIN domain-containing protein [Anaerolineales bacterium]|nr:PIN domain-containing protein [Anaerolineales bacterium]